MAKAVVCLTTEWMQVKTKQPLLISVVRSEKRTKVIATADIEPGLLHVPLFFRRDTSVVFPGEHKAQTNFESVRAKVAWDHTPIRLH